MPRAAQRRARGSRPLPSDRGVVLQQARSQGLRGLRLADISEALEVLAFARRAVLGERCGDPLEAVGTYALIITDDLGVRIVADTARDRPYTARCGQQNRRRES